MTISYDDVVEGDLLPPFLLPLTVQRLVMEAGVNRDFAPIHSDRELAQASGAPDMYANTMLFQALFEGSLRQWMGLGGRLRKLGFSMRSFTMPGHEVTVLGRVTGKRADDGQGFVDLEVWTEVDGNRTAEGTATVELPTRAGVAGG